MSFLNERSVGGPIVPGVVTTLLGREIFVGSVLFEGNCRYRAIAIEKNTLGEDMIRGVDSDGHFRNMTVDHWFWEIQSPKKGHQLSNMLEFVTQRFNGRFDKGGSPYVLHCLKVMHYTKSDDEEIQCIALGHDLIEDTFRNLKEGIEFLRYRGFSDRIILGIVAMTKVSGQTYEEYKALVKANPDAIVVKMADLRHNTDIRRLKGVTEKDLARVARYHAFYEELKAVA